MNTPIIDSVLTLLISCSGQYVTHSEGNPSISFHGDTVQELSNNIMLVYQDKKYNYWFGSWQDGLFRLDASPPDGQGKSIIHYTAGNVLPDNRVEEIKEDSSGNIYINTPKGICKYDGQNFVTLSIASYGSEWKLEPNDLWFRQGWDSGFVYRYDGSFLYKLPAPKHPDYSNPYAVYCIYKDTRGNVWFGTNPLGAFRYNGKTFDWISEEDVAELHNGPANGVRSIIEDKDGYFWFNSLYLYNIYGEGADKKIFYSREKSIGSLDGKANGNLIEYLSIAKDNNNELWVATYRDGIWRYNGHDIIHYPVRAGTKDITVFTIYKDNYGQLWLGTHENGVYKFNGTTFEKFIP